MHLSISLRATLVACLALLALATGCPGQDGGEPKKCPTCDAHATCDSTAATPVCVCNTGYTGNGTSCQPITCPALTLENGSVTPAGEATLNTTATYSCNAGYKLSGEATRKCISTGWNGTAPTCVEVIDGCKDHPCLHGPCTSTSDTGGYSCGPCEAGWTGANCDAPVACPTLEDPTNGSVTPKSGTAGASATYACQAGYTLTGEATRQCQNDGTWSGAAPACTPNPCTPDLAAPANGTVSAQSGVTGDVVTYGCNDGFTLTGNTTRLCQTDGTWSGADPTCAANQNGCSTNPCAHGTCTPDGATGFTCACDSGWAGDTCSDAVTCSGATAPAHGSVSTATAAFGATVTYSCDLGYALTGTATRTCQADGTFSGSAPTCEPTACAPDLTAPANGSVSQSHGVTGDVATYTCDSSFVLSGSSTRLCQADGTWSGTTPTCVSVQSGCSPNPCLNGGTCTPSGSTGFSCACAAGWSGTTCTDAVTCSGATAPAHGSVSAATATYGHSVTYSCDAGYTLGGGSAARECQADGTFAGAAPTCTANPCPALTAPANGTVSAASGVTGDVVTYGCNGGYSIQGAATRTCQTSGTWSGTAPTCQLVMTGCTPNPCVHSASCTPVGATGYSCGTCDAGWQGANCDQPITCSGAVAPAHGSVSAATATFGNAVTYGCDGGYTLSGSATRACQANGTFAGTAPTCAPVNCGAPPSVTNAGAPVISGGAGGGVTPTFGATAAYTCNASYAKAGSDPTCGASGTWSAAPTCSPINCGTPPVVANAGAPAVSGGLGGGAATTVGATAAYTCDPGYGLSGSNPVCGVNGSWSAAPSCNVIDCNAAPAVANAGAPVVSGGLGGGATTTYGATAAYTCSPGFTKSGSNAVCGASGWSTPPTCAPVDCGAAPAVTNAGAPVVSGGAGGGATTTYNATAAYTCNANYAKTGANPTCQANGSWSAAPKCDPVNCGAAPTVANAGAPAITGGLGGAGTTTVGATAAYTCNSGFTVKTGADPVCRATGLWDTAPTCNPVNCGNAPTVANAGAAVVSGGAGGGSTTTFQATAAYTCSSGFAKNGSDAVCQATGAWTTAPTCTATSCGTYTDVVYRLTGTFTIADTFLGMGNGSYTGLGANTSNPAFGGSGNTTPFTTAAFTNGFARLRFTNDASGNPTSGAVRLVEWYFPLNYTQTAGATIVIDTDHSVGLLASGQTNCGSGDATCTNHAPTLSRPCSANAQGTVSGTALTWGTCTATSGSTGWDYGDARAATGVGCASGWTSWGHAGPCSGSNCSMVPSCTMGDSYQAWNQQLKSLTFSSSSYKTATITMPRIQLPNCTSGVTGSTTTWLTITASTVLATQCGSTPGTDLVCNIQ
ncbi:MAG: hypothetical protein QM765_26975 [Myxococcales bacterium]